MKKRIIISMIFIGSVVFFLFIAILQPKEIVNNVLETSFVNSQNISFEFSGIGTIAKESIKNECVEGPCTVKRINTNPDKLVDEASQLFEFDLSDIEQEIKELEYKNELIDLEIKAGNEKNDSEIENSIIFLETEKKIIENKINDNCIQDRETDTLKSEYNDILSKLNAYYTTKNNMTMDINEGLEIQKRYNEDIIQVLKNKETEILNKQFCKSKGKILEVFAYEGMEVVSSQLLYTYAEKDVMFDIELEKEYWELLNVGDSLNVKTEKGIQLSAKVVEVNDFEVIKENGTSVMKIKIQFDDENVLALLDNNERYNINFTKKDKERIWVDFESIVFDNEKTYVYLLSDGEYQKKEIQIGTVYESSIEVLEGLKNGDEIVKFADSLEN